MESVFNLKKEDWWSNRGPLKMLHLMNRVRLKFILDNSDKVYKSRHLNVLDVGCGGGILSQPLARLGYNVTGIDISKTAIESAMQSSLESEVHVNYLNIPIDEVNKKFDIICVLEVLEHVNDFRLFLRSCIERLNKNGIIFISTINRTLLSFFESIFIAENFGFVPKKTHEWKKFIKPSEIASFLVSNEFKIIDLSGMRFNLFSFDWSLDKNIENNYILSAMIN